MKEFGEHSTKLEFDEFDDMTTDGGQPEGKSKGKTPPEEANEDGKGGRGEEGEEDEELESKPRKAIKPPAVDEYQWQWKVSNLGSRLVAPY